MKTDKRLVVIMPAHNEAANLPACLDSFVRQTRKPDLLLIVDDGSTDSTADIAASYAGNHSWIRCVRKPPSGNHQPGAKVIRCFQYGLDKLGEPWDYIGKFDADVQLPENYFQRILEHWTASPAIGMCSGLLYVDKRGTWEYEPIADQTHVRGPLKLYSKSCFEAIGGLRASIGWDTADTLLARYHGYRVETLPDLRVLHLRPTASAYASQNALKQGEALYKLRYGWVLGSLAALKMAWKRKSPASLAGNLKGAWQAARGQRGEPLLSPEEGRFARKWRWRQLRRKLF